MVKKSAHEYQQKDKELVLKDIKSLTKIRDDLKKEIKTTKEEHEFNHSQRVQFCQNLIKEFAKQVSTLKRSVASLKVAEKSVLRNIKVLRARYADVQKQLSDQITKRQEVLVVIEENIKRAEEDETIVRGRVGEVTGELSILKDELDELTEQIYFNKRELSSLNDTIGDAEDTLTKLNKKIAQFRADVLSISEGKKELAIRLHDAKALELRLKPEFKKLMKSFLSKPQYAILD